MSVVGVVPAAGRATRLQPMVGSKEMLAVHGRPVVDHLLTRLDAAPCDRIRVVTRPDKTDLCHHLLDRGCEVEHGEPPHVAASLLLGLAGLADLDIALVGFPDTLWLPGDGFARLLAAVRGGADVALGLFTLPDVRAADEVQVDAQGQVRAVRPKPARPISPLTWGCVAARVGALAGLREVTEPGSLFDRLAREQNGSVVGVDLGAQFLDIGTPSGLARAHGPEGLAWTRTDLE